MDKRIMNSFTKQRERFALKRFEDNFNMRHQNWIDERIEEKRNYTFNSVDPSLNQLTDINSNCNFEELNSQVSKMKVDNINPVNLQNIHIFIAYISQNLFTDKAKTKYHLKLLRKEISKDYLQVDVLNMLLNSEQSLLLILADFLFDFKNSEIQIETIWILNNLCIFCHRYGFKDHFYQIHKILITFMQSENCFSNAGVKILILEKFFSLVGNLILYEENVYHVYISSNILVYLVKNLNASVRSMRAVCLWNLNTIITSINNCNENNVARENSKKLISDILFNNKELLYYLKFIFVRIDPSKNFDECYEFFWLMNYIQQENPEIFASFFLREGVDTCLPNFRKILNYLIISNLHQPIIRIFGNLLSNKYNIYFDSNQIAGMVLNDKNVMVFLSGILKNNNFNINPGNRCQYNLDQLDVNKFLLKDAVWLIKNLNYYDKNNIIQNFLAYDLINLLGDILNIKIDKNILEDVTQNVIVVLYSVFICENFYFNQENFKLFSYLIDSVYKNVECFVSFKLIILDLIINFIIYKNNRVVPIGLGCHIDHIKEKNL